MADDSPAPSAAPSARPGPKRRPRGRPFEKGRGGRPPGARNKATLAAEALFDGEAEALSRRAIGLALEGNTVALRLCIERILPARRERRLDVAIAPIASMDDAAAASSRVIGLLASGEIAPSEARAFGALLDTHLRARDAAGIERQAAQMRERERTRPPLANLSDRRLMSVMSARGRGGE